MTEFRRNENFRRFRKEFHRIALFGGGISNLSLLPFFASLNAEITLYAETPPPDMPKGVSYIPVGKTPVLPEKADIVIRAPGWRFPFDYYEEARKRHIRVTTEAGLFLYLSPLPVIGITGSDGKSTTATAVASILREDGKNVYLGGNIGVPLLPCIFDMEKKGGYAVAELSSFQLFDALQPPHAAILTCLTPNHLNWHSTYAEYGQAKTRIFPHEAPAFADAIDGRLLVSGLSEDARALAKTRRGVWYFGRETDSIRMEGGYAVTSVFGKTEKLFSQSDLPLPGKYNTLNYLSAAALLYGVVSKAAIRSAVKNAKGLPHRLSLVRTVSHIRFFDSSVDSSPSRTEATLSALGEKVTVIAGGAGKGVTMAPLRETFRKYARRVIVTGETAKEIAAVLEGTGIPVVFAETLSQAVKIAYESAKAGEAVVLSPASTSFDAFRNFEERGDVFTEEVNRLTDKKDK